METPTHCPYCALQCGMTVRVSDDAHEGLATTRNIEITARDFPTNRGSMCRKGWAAAELLAAGDRILTPLLRESKGQPLRPASWDEAIDHIGRSIEQLQRAHGNDAIAVFGGGGLTNETAYSLGKFARVVLRSRHIDYNGRFCMAAAAVAQQRALGIDRGLPFPLQDLTKAAVILVVGANPAETMPPLMQYFDEQRAAGGRIIVVDPRRTRTAEYATTHLQLAPGTDGVLAHGLLHVLVRDHRVDEAFIADRTTGFDAVRREVARYWPDRVERATGVAAAEIVRTAHALADASSVCALSGRGAEQQGRGVDNLLAFINVLLALGQFGKPHSGFGSLTGQGNGQGGREHGQKSDQLPGYRSLENPEHRAVVAKAWGVAPETLPRAGPSACEMLDAIGNAGGPKALIVMGSNLVVSAPDAAHVERQLGALDLLVVADAFLSETAAQADVVLPVCHWAEHDGTLTNLEGRVLMRRQAVPRPFGVRTDLEILARLAQRLGAKHAIDADPQSVFAELAKTSRGGIADYAGLSYPRLQANDALFWPCPRPDHPGTPRLFLDRFPTSDGRARFHAVHMGDAADPIDDEFPFYLTTGRLLAHYQTGTQTHRCPTLEDAEPASFAQMHPQLAATFRLADGDFVTLRTRRGSAVMRVRVSTDMRLDTIFVPFHWSGSARANTLTARILDPAAKIPQFKLCAVALEPLTPPSLDHEAIPSTPQQSVGAP